MSLAAVVDLAVFLVAMIAIGCGVGCAVSPSWSAVVVGALLLVVLVISRRTGGRKE